MAKAAILEKPGEGLVIGEIAVADPLPHEVLIDTRACGLCHSDLHFIDGAYPHALPLVPGHERQGVGIGAVDEVQVRMAQAAGPRVDQHLVRQRVGHRDLADHQPFAGLFEDCRLRHQRVAPMSPELTASLAGWGECLANSIRAIDRAWTSSGPSARRSVRWWA